jgi:hypothetical protein
MWRLRLLASRVRGVFGPGTDPEFEQELFPRDAGGAHRPDDWIAGGVIFAFATPSHHGANSRPLGGPARSGFAWPSAPRAPG